MRMKVVTFVVLIQIVVVGSRSAHAATPTPSAKESPAISAAPAVSATPARAMRAPRPTPTCKPGTHAVGPEDPNCNAFGDCCKPDGAQKGG
jgi:hypothetical protein